MERRIHELRPRNPQAPTFLSRFSCRGSVLSAIAAIAVACSNAAIIGGESETKSLRKDPSADAASSGGSGSASEPPEEETTPDVSPIEEIIKAACYGDLEKIRAYVDEGGNINAQDENKFTILICASNYGNFDIVQYALENGADINIQDNEGLAAIHHAALYLNFEIFKYLLSKHPNLELKDKDGFTVFCYMAIFGGEYLPYANLLIIAGADVDNPDYDGVTPLMKAALNRNKTMVELILSQCPDIDMKDNFGNSAEDYALDGGDPEIVAIIQNAVQACKN